MNSRETSGICFFITLYTFLYLKKLSQEMASKIQIMKITKIWNLGFKEGGKSWLFGQLKLK